MTNPAFIQGKELCCPLIPKGFTAELEAQPWRHFLRWCWQQQQGLFGPKSSSVPAPGRCLGSTRVSLCGNNILEETRSIQVICWLLHHLKWDFRGAPVQQRLARATQATGGLPEVLLQRSSAQGCHLLSAALPRDPGRAQPKPNHPKPLQSSKPPRGHSQERPPQPSLGSGHISGRARPGCAQTREVVSCKVPFPSRSISGKGRVEVQGQGREGNAALTLRVPHGSTAGKISPRARGTQGWTRQLQGCPRDAVG